MNATVDAVQVLVWWLCVGFFPRRSHC